MKMRQVWMELRPLQRATVGVWIAMVVGLAFATAAYATPATDLATQAKITTEQAERDIAAQESGPAIVTELRGALGDCYGGVWFNNKTARFVVRIPESCSTAKAQAKTILGADRPGTYPLVQQTYAALEATEDTLNAQLANYVQEARAGVHIDPQAGKVRVLYAKTLAGSAKTEIKTAAANMGSTATTGTDTAGVLPMKLATCTFPYCTGGWPPVVGGVKVDAPGIGWCTAGFIVKDQAGNRYMLTARHCLFDAMFSPGMWETGGCQYAHDNQAMIEGEHWDAGIIPVSTACESRQSVQTWDEQNTILGYGPRACPPWGCATPPTPSAAVAYVGQWVCRAGARTGYGCGTVKYTDAVGGIVGGGWFEHVDGITMYANLGDSGGPLFGRSGDAATATGVLSLTNAQPCVETGPTCFSGETEVVSAASALGVHF